LEFSKYPQIFYQIKFDKNKKAESALNPAFYSKE